MESTDLLSAMSVFEPHNFPSTEDELSTYGKEDISQLTNFYGVVQKAYFDGQEGVSQPDVDSEGTEAEWKLFQQLISIHYKGSSIYQVLSKLICHGDIAKPLSKLAMSLAVLTVTTATVERSFSSMKHIQTRLQSRMGDDTLESTMHICIEGPYSLDGNILEDIVNHCKAVKHFINFMYNLI